MKKKTVCFFNSCKTWGGGEKWHYDISTRLSQNGYKVVVVTNKGSELYWRLEKWNLKLYGIKISNLSFLNIFKILRVYRILKHETTKTLILNLPSDLKIAGIAAKLAGIEKIIYRRGSAIPIKNTFFNRFLFRHVITAIIANSEATKRTILSNNPHLIAQDKIKVIYNGINLQDYDNKCLVPLYVRKKKEIILGTAGRLEKVKNQKFLINLAKSLKERQITFKLLIAGEGVLAKDLKAHVKILALDDEVRFLGFIDDMASFMASLDVFVLSSLYEGFGYVLIEAMASRKPVITFNNSSSPEIVEDQQTGFLIIRNDLEDFIQKVLFFANNRQMIADFGARGRKRVEEDFDISKSLRIVEKII